MRLGRGFRAYSRRFGAITTPSVAGPTNLTWGPATATVAMVAPTLRIDYTPVPTATTSALIAVPPVLSESYVVPAATATVDGVNEVTSFTYAVPAATASVTGGDIQVTRPAPAAEASVAMVAPTLRIDYAVPAATTSALIAVPPVLSDTYVVPAAQTSALIAVPPTLSDTYTVPAATATAAGVNPVLSHTLAVGAATATVAMPDVGITIVGTLSLTWDTATATVAAIPPALSDTYTTPAATTSAAAVAPALSVTSGVNSGTVNGEGVAPTTSFTFGVTTATATAAMPDVTLQILSIVTLIVDSATATVAGGSAGLSATYGVPAGSSSGAGVNPTTNFTFAVGAATASVAMPDVGYTEVETLTLTWDAATASVIAVPPALSDTYSVPAATATCAAVPPALNVTLSVQTATITAAGVPPALAFTYGVPAAEASVVGGNVAVTSDGDFQVFAAEASVQLIAPVLSITVATASATATVEMPDVGYAELGELDLIVDAATASVEMPDVDLVITPGVPAPTPGASGGQLLEFVFNDLDLKVEPATCFVEMIPPVLKTYRQVKRRIPFIRPVPVMREITFEERLWEIQPKEQPEIVFTTRPLKHHFFSVEPQHMLLFGVEPVERQLVGFSSPLWGRYRRRTPKEELHEMILLGILD